MKRTMDRMSMLKETLKILIEGDFNGYLKINFSQGTLGRVEKSEECGYTDFILAEEIKRGSV